jgi:hypothetical protein
MAKKSFAAMALGKERRKNHTMYAPNSFSAFPTLYKVSE